MFKLFLFNNNITGTTIKNWARNIPIYVEIDGFPPKSIEPRAVPIINAERTENNTTKKICHVDWFCFTFN